MNAEETVAAILHQLAAQIREQIANEIEASKPKCRDGWCDEQHDPDCYNGIIWRTKDKDAAITRGNQ